MNMYDETILTGVIFYPNSGDYLPTFQLAYAPGCFPIGGTHVSCDTVLEAAELVREAMNKERKHDQRTDDQEG